MVYTDYAKAFDKFEIGVLLHRLLDSGIMGKVGSWLAAFLDMTTRQQAVGVDKRLSALRPVTSMNSSLSSSGSGRTCPLPNTFSTWHRMAVQLRRRTAPGTCIQVW